MYHTYCAGSSSGIGAQTAVDFACQGAHVVITGRNKENIMKTLDRCIDAGSTEKKVGMMLM